MSRIGKSVKTENKSVVVWGMVVRVNREWPLMGIGFLKGVIKML